MARSSEDGGPVVAEGRTTDTTVAPPTVVQAPRQAPPNWRPPSGSTPIKSGKTVAGYVLPNGTHVTAGGVPLPPGSVVYYSPHGITGWLIGGSNGHFVSLSDVDNYLSMPNAPQTSTMGATTATSMSLYPPAAPQAAAPAAAAGAGAGPNAATYTPAGIPRNVYLAICQAADENGVPRDLALAIAQQESGFDPNRPGDGGTSFGLFQLHQGGELTSAGLTPQQAMDPLTNARVALKVVGSVLRQHPDWTPGQIAAAAQRPQDAAGYANSVNAILGKGTFTYVPPGDAGLTKISGGAVGGGSYGAAGAGGAGAGVAATPDFSENAYNKALQGSGFAAGLIQSDPSLQEVIHKAVTQRLDLGTPAGQAAFQNLVQNSAWYKSRSDSQRTWDELIYSDNATAHRMLGTMQAKVANMATQLGVTLSPTQLTEITHTAARSGLTDQEIQRAIGGGFHYSPDASYGGTAGQTLSQLTQYAQQMNIPLDNNTLGQFAQNVVAGKATVEQYQNYILQQAQSKYPWLSEQLKQGFTVGQLADPFKQEMGKLLEIDPTTISTNDPMVLKGMQYQDPTNTKGGYSTMPLWKFQQTVKQDPRWLQTDNARNSMMDTGVGVLKDFGLVY